MPKPQILIASSKHDGLNYGTVAHHLTSMGCEVVLFEPDSIADGNREFTICIEPSGRIISTYDNKTFVPESFHAAWHRRPHYFGEHRDQLRWLSLKDEYSSIINTIAALIPAERWLNTAPRMKVAGQKLPQLIAAAQHGFVIPQTVTTNKWPNVEKLKSEKVIIKYAELAILYGAGKRKTLPTTILSRKKLPKRMAPYPGIWQPFQEKHKEWRVTVVGDAVFSVAIYCDEKAKNDWRMLQETESVTFKVEPFPQRLQQKCRTFLKKLHLRYGAFDFIERPDGTIVFLEVNPNGQFMWLEDKLGLPISRAIADELLLIAKSHM